MRVCSIDGQIAVVTCVDMYLSMNDWLEVDRKASIENFLKLRGSSGYFRCIVDGDGSIAAWSCFMPVVPLHARLPQFQQVYYASDKRGLQAARCVRILHRDAAERAISLGLRTIISQGSHMDEGNVFARLLEKDGWERRGHTALLRLPRQGARLGAGRTFFSR